MGYPLIIEFAGISGCGKTTRALKTVSALRDKGFNVWSRMEQKRFSISFMGTFLLHPIHSVAFIKDKKRKDIFDLWEKAGGEKEEDNIALKTKWWAWMDLWRLFQSGMKSKNHAAVFDEGMIQHLISAYSGKSIIPENFVKFAEKYAEYSGKHVFIVMNTPLEICIKRLAERKNLPARMRNFSKEKIAERLQNDKKLLDIIQNGLQSAGMDVITIGGIDIECDMEIIVTEIFRKLKE